jgi:hypothetical protein
MKKTEAVKEFLAAQENASDVAQLYCHNMEVQVNVKPSPKIVTKLSSAGKRFQAYTDGEETWKHFRIPWNAKANPTYSDGNLTFSTKHFQAIGMTGWNWAEKKAEWVGFDFDSIASHQKGLTDEQLKEIFERVKSIDWVSVYTSTSGRGYHLYVFIQNSPELATHTDHAAFARAILSKLSGLCGFPLSERVDVAGGILWVWKEEAKGFKQLREGKPLDGSTILDWESHRSATRIRGRRSTNLSKESAWQSLNNSIRRIELEPDHLQLLKFLDEKHCLHWWDADHWMLVAHTFDLKEAHNELGFQGFFDTVSTGKEQGQDQNCFAFPLMGGAWVIRRHSPGTTEHSSWRNDRSGWTYCYYNRLPSVNVAASLYGIEGKADTYNFKQLTDCLRSVECLGIDLDPLDAHYLNREAHIKELSDSKILIQFAATDHDPDIEGWFKKKRFWKRLFPYLVSLKKVLKLTILSGMLWPKIRMQAGMFEPTIIGS